MFAQSAGASPRSTTATACSRSTRARTPSATPTSRLGAGRSGASTPSMAAPRMRRSRLQLSVPPRRARNEPGRPRPVRARVLGAPWAGADPATCGGTETVLYDGPVLGRADRSPGPGHDRRGARSRHFLAVFSLPDPSPDTMQGQEAFFAFSFTASNDTETVTNLPRTGVPDLLAPLMLAAGLVLAGLILARQRAGAAAEARSSRRWHDEGLREDRLGGHRRRYRSGHGGGASASPRRRRPGRTTSTTREPGCARLHGQPGVRHDGLGPHRRQPSSSEAQIDPIAELNGITVDNLLDADPTISEAHDVATPNDLGDNAWSSNVDATALSLINASIGAGLFASPDTGVYTSTATRERPGSSTGASGVITTSEGGVTLGSADPEAPGVGSLSLQGILSEVIGDALGGAVANLADLSLNIGAVASSTTLDACAPLWDDQAANGHARLPDRRAGPVVPECRSRRAGHGDHEPREHPGHERAGARRAARGRRRCVGARHLHPGSARRSWYCGQRQRHRRLEDHHRRPVRRARAADLGDHRQQRIRVDQSRNRRDHGGHRSDPRLAEQSAARTRRCSPPR